MRVIFPNQSLFQCL